MTNRTKIVLIMAGLGAGIAGVFNLVHALTGGAWALSVPAALTSAVAARWVYWWAIGRMMNDGAVVPTGHGPDGRIDAIEVFWRPG